MAELTKDGPVRRTGPSLSSAFASRLEGYIDYKRALGYKATADRKGFAPAFDRLCRREFPDKETFDKELALAWVRESDSPFVRKNRAGFARQFARYLIEEAEEEAYVLPRGAAPPSPPAKPPHLFTREELDAFFAVADAMEPSPLARARHLVAPVFFRLLLCCGLRPKEARELPVELFDLENGVIHIVDSKDGRDRDVPVHEDVRALCAAYSAAVEAVFPGREWFFPGSRGGLWSRDSMRCCFRKCWEEAGVTEFSGPRPVPYSFRHTFATNTIRRWREAGVDVRANLRFLQEFMGHEDISGTLYYLHLVRGGLGDPTSVPTWSPADRTKEGGYYYVEV